MSKRAGLLWTGLLQKLLLISVWLFVLLLGLLGGIISGWAMPIAHAFPGTASIALLAAHQEAPGQVLYKSFNTFQDQYGRKWRSIAFNHTFPDGHHDFQLRLVGFPGVATVDRDRPLQIKTPLGRTFQAQDTAKALFKSDTTTEPNVAQYDLAPIVAQLPNLIPLRLSLPLEANDDLRLLVGPNAIREWQAVALGKEAAIAWSEHKM
ncbi:MAG: DUF3122 domain-containing protein [Cyanothece sp. SIO2G6]|nr:DUF3122 domain-containing protein [Cyanothece sp. SIO2G6]